MLTQYHSTPTTTLLQKIVIACWILLGLSYYFYTWHDMPSFISDGFIYLLQADYFSPYSDIASNITDYAIRSRSFPPLYPLLLGLLGGGSQNIAISYFISTSFLLLAVWFFIQWLRQLNFEIQFAWGLGVLFLLLPRTLLFVQEIWSEYLYLLWVFVCFYAIEKSRQNSKWLYFAGLSCGLAIISRTVGISLILALLVYLIYHRRPYKIRVISLALLPLLLWKIYSLVMDITYYSGNYGSDLLENYHHFIEIMQGDVLAMFWELLLLQSKTFGLAWLLNFDSQLSPLILVIGGLSGILAILGWLQRLLNITYDAVYVLIYFAIIFVWNFPDQNTRFIHILFPILMFYALNIIIYSLDKAKLYSKFIKVEMIFLLVILITIMPALISIGKQYFYPLPSNIQYLHHNPNWLYADNRNQGIKELGLLHEIIVAIKKIPTIVRTDQCVSSVMPELIIFFAQRSSIYVPNIDTSEKQFKSELSQCDYLLLLNIKHPAVESFYPAARLNATDMIPVFQQVYQNAGKTVLVAILLKTNLD